MAYTYNPITNDLLEMIDLYDEPIKENKKKSLNQGVQANDGLFS